MRADHLIGNNINPLIIWLVILLGCSLSIFFGVKTVDERAIYCATAMVPNPYCYRTP